ncbi:MAG: alpha/beta hydrolase family esterase [Paracoccus hibiscisoli]|uniref:extracellular catalytic domain type 1 short-chain-length polyhydroxyalkanoate depolymerase n=1 Tax=Paracoccus hibiscisoli TaxID=2023261 RepID=UPI003919E3FF
MAKRIYARARSRRIKAPRNAMGAMMAGLIGATAKAMVKATRTTVAASAKKPAKVVVRPARAPASAPAVRARPSGSGRFISGSHDCNFGARTYRLYVPSVAVSPVASVPLVVMLHGCGQTPEDFAKGTRMNTLAQDLGVMVLYPAQSRDAHPNRCWNWFREGDQQRGGGELALLADMVRTIIASHPVDPARVYVAGLSAGASAALLLAHAYPDLFAAVGCHSGLPTGAARDKGSALIAMKQGNPGTRLDRPVPTIIFHGSDDHVVTARNGRLVALRALETFPRLEVTEQARQVAKGRAYVRTLHRIGRGRAYVEHWLIKGSGHAWSGGSRSGRFVDPTGPDASREMLRFFLRHKTTLRTRRAIRTE